jgi:predicted metal-dependent phosphoesterase TrpH
MELPGSARIDCHIHSKYSPDGKGELHELVKVAQEKGLTGIVVSDHNVYKMAAEMNTADFGDFTLIPAEEISVREGHCLALGIRELVPPRLPLVETLEKIRAAGGIGVPSHPFRRVHGVGEVAIDAALKQLRALEVYNARDGPKSSNARGRSTALRLGLGGTGGSDAHQIFEVGNAFTVFKERVDDVDDFLDQIEKKRTWGQGVPTPRSKLFLQNAKNAWLFARRGFRSI